MKGFSTTSETTKAIAPGGVISKEGRGIESLFMFHHRNRLKGEAEMLIEAGSDRVGGLDTAAHELLSVRRPLLLIGTTEAHWGVGRSTPILFVESHRNSNGVEESGGSGRLGPVSVN